MLQRLTARPWAVLRFARTLAELHADMHSRRAPDLPSQRRRLERKIQAAEPLPPDLKDAALKALARLPQANAVCHGDFHPDNVLLTARGPVVIDWPDATRGHPLADVARTSLLMRLGGLPPGAARRWLIQALRTSFHTAYLRRYFQLRPGSRELLAAWQVPVAAARLEEGIGEEVERLVELVRGSLSG
jgi:aminoglycoside phosphotransferase (APT) family kinase protein